MISFAISLFLVPAFFVGAIAIGEFHHDDRAKRRQAENTWFLVWLALSLCWITFGAFSSV